jgi:predicted nuclease with RNAse H fold
MFFGIDYGSKLAGTTVIAFIRDGMIELVSSKKKEDADALIKKYVEYHKPVLIGIDAPLSLPSAYSNRGNDFFYRQCDKEMRAMSPMFLGGLTARAMKLNAELGLKMIEVYPGGLARSLELNEFHYKKKEVDIAGIMARLDWSYSLSRVPNSSHEIDAVLALYIAWKFNQGLAMSIGDPEEGLIYY